jgi:hypothetical protein
MTVKMSHFVKDFNIFKFNNYKIFLAKKTTNSLDFKMPVKAKQLVKFLILILIRTSWTTAELFLIFNLTTKVWKTIQFKQQFFLQEFTFTKMQS